MNSDKNNQVANHIESMGNLVQSLRNDINHIQNPKGQALFETAAEVLIGLSKAFKHYQNKEEQAWK